MRNSLLCIAFATAILATGGAAHAAMQKGEKPAAFAHVEPVICEGRRRNYRSFKQCVRLRGARRANYCGRICR